MPVELDLTREGRPEYGTDSVRVTAGESGVWLTVRIGDQDVRLFVDRGPGEFHPELGRTEGQVRVELLYPSDHLVVKRQHGTDCPECSGNGPGGVGLWQPPGSGSDPQAVEQCPVCKGRGYVVFDTDGDGYDFWEWYRDFSADPARMMRRMKYGY